MSLKNIFGHRNRALLSELVRTDFKLRYQGSVLGYTWSLLRPLLLFLTLYVVFVKFLKIGDGVPHYPVYLLLGIVIWTFFAEMTAQSLSSIVGRGDLIRKIKIPRWIIIVSTSISALINMSLTMIVIIIFMFMNHVPVMRTILLVPLILLQVYVLALGVSLFLSATYVKYRDMTYVWEVVLQAAFYVTPILYPLSSIPGLKYQKLLLLNPMATFIQDARYALVTHSSKTIDTLYVNHYVRAVPYAITIFVLLLGVLYFKKRAPTFAEDL